MARNEPTKVWLEDLSVGHLRDIYTMFLDPTMQLLSSPCADQSIEFCRHQLELWLQNRRDKPWHMAKLIMSSSHQPGRAEPEAVGAIYTKGPSFYGLQLRFEVRRECEGRGFATEGLRQFLEAYWHPPSPSSSGSWQKRRAAPVGETLLAPRFFASREMREDWERARSTIREVGHLIAATDRQDGHAQRVLEKLGLRPEEEEEMFPCYFYRLKKMDGVVRRE